MIADRLAHIQAQVPEDVTLIVVTKNHTVEEIWQVYNAGARDFGENRVQELMSKVDHLPKDIRWHLIGTLQRNKVKYIAPFISCIQSVDSLALYEEVLLRAQKAERCIDFLIEVHIAEEDSKSGMPLAEVEPFIQTIMAREENRPYVRLRGLMAMATNTDCEGSIRGEFAQVKRLFDHLRKGIMASEPAFDTLSMGMSDDWHVAVEEGSTMIRVGTAIMGPRSY